MMDAMEVLGGPVQPPSSYPKNPPKSLSAEGERLHVDLRYDSRPNWTTYERLLRMSQILLDRLRPLGARDWIDVQSFIYVVRD
jgi:hypothetical protein